jgi:hypothetical protein
MTCFLHRCWLTLLACFRREPVIVGPVHCVNCGWSDVAIVPVRSPHYHPETGVLDMIECPECGLFLVCSS